MRQRQRGITLIGWIFLLIPMAIVVYAGIRVTPFYLNHLKVVKALDQTAKEYAGETQLNTALVRNSLAKRFDIDLIVHPKDTDVAVRKSGAGWELEADYEQVVPLFYNVQLLVVFNKRVEIPAK